MSPRELTYQVLHWFDISLVTITVFTLFVKMRISITDNTGLQAFFVEKLWVVSGVIFDVESESGIRISLSRQDFETFEVMCSKNGVFRYF